MDIDYFGILKGAAFSVFCLGGAFWLLRGARQRALRNRNRTRYVQPSRRVVRDPRLTRPRVPPNDEGGMSTTRLVWHQKDNSQDGAA